MLTIVDVDKSSPGARAGIRPGDQLNKINGHPIRDNIDFHFYSADDVLKLQIIRNGKKRTVKITPEEGRGLGLNFEAMRYCACGNHCIFCFVDQNPNNPYRG